MVAVNGIVKRKREDKRGMWLLAFYTSQAPRNNKTMHAGACILTQGHLHNCQCCHCWWCRDRVTPIGGSKCFDNQVEWCRCRQHHHRSTNCIVKARVSMLQGRVYMYHLPHGIPDAHQHSVVTANGQLQHQLINRVSLCCLI